MNKNAASKVCLPTVLVVSNDQSILINAPSTIDSLNQVCIPILEATQVISWVQEHQPDLIILDVCWSEVINMQLNAALRLDWLTRNIPILVIASSDTQQCHSLAKLDYDACLVRPYEPEELAQTVFSLISNSACEMHSKIIY
ncbi:MAG: response regulator [Cyanobacteria bacterium J06621_8]